MSPKLKAVVALAGAAAVAALLRRSPGRDGASSAGRDARGLLAPDIDDDTAAEIIRRARPALDKAAALNS